MGEVTAGYMDVFCNPGLIPVINDDFIATEATKNTELIAIVTPFESVAGTVAINECKIFFYDLRACGHRFVGRKKAKRCRRIAQTPLCTLWQIEYF